MTLNISVRLASEPDLECYSFGIKATLGGLRRQILLYVMCVQRLLKSSGHVCFCPLSLYVDFSISSSIKMYSRLEKKYVELALVEPGGHFYWLLSWFRLFAKLDLSIACCSASRGRRGIRWLLVLVLIWCQQESNRHAMMGLETH